MTFCIESEKKYEKRHELCTVTPVNTYSMLYRCLRLPKTKRENMHRSSISNPDQNNIMFQHDYNPKCKCLTSFFFFTATAFILRCDAATQRRRHLRIVSCMLLQLHFAHSHFVLLIVQARKKYRTVGQQNQTCVCISNFPAATV